MARRGNRDESMEDEPEGSSRKNPRRGTKPVAYTEEKAEVDDPMDVDPADEEASEGDADDELENAGRKSKPRSRRSKVAASKESIDEPERRKSSRSTKFRDSMKEPSDKAFQLVATSSSKKPNNRRKGNTSDMELDDDDEDNKPIKKTQRKSNKRGSQKQTKKQQKMAKETSTKHKSPARRHRQARPTIGHNSSADSDYDQSDQSIVDSEVTDDEESEEEPFKIQRILASRTEPKKVWTKICQTMNTSEIDFGSRWVQEEIDNDAHDDDDDYEERFLVKWADMSYMHVSWETEKDLTEQVEGAKTYLSTFFRKSHHGLLFDSDERCDGDYFDPAWTQVDRVLEVQFPEDCPCKAVKDEDKVTNEDLGIILDKEHPDFEVGLGREFLIKWGNAAYSEATYEYERDLILNEIDHKDQLKAFHNRRTKPTKDKAKKLQKEGEAEFRRLYKSVFGDKSDAQVEGGVEDYQRLLQERVYKNGGQLRDYQAEGVSWLMANFVNKRSSILADEMGLGKTLQTASFVNLIATSLNRRGPFLIVAPLSTLAHWQREFMGWTVLNTVVYHGSAQDRRYIREYEISHENFRPTDGVGFNQMYLKKCLPKKNKNFVGNPWMAEVVITTPELITADDFMELTAVQWECLVVDEAQKLKNHSSKLATNLRDPKFHFGHKLLLTGTPIQNTMQELFALLNFVDQDQFPDCNDFMEKYGDMKSKDNLDSLHEEIRPYILRRLKEDVEKSVPPKEETVIEVELTVTQKQYYRALYERNVKFLHKNKKKALDGPSLNNLGMQLRKCCNHLYLLNGIEEELRAKQRMEGQALSEGDILVKASGKLVLLDKLLPRLKENGHRILIFSQFKIMLDVLEDYLNARTLKFERIDGSITGKKRQQAIDRFQAKGAEGKELPFIMLLSTRAGGVGINLTAADTCIIFDSDFNPQNDLQAQARCHRIGQTKSVKVYRLLSRQTYEMQMFHMSSLKMGLDQAVLSGFETGSSGDGALSKDEVERLLRHGAYGIFSEDKEGAEAESNSFVQQDLDTILERRARTVIHDNVASKNNAGSTFSKARFSAPKGIEGKKGSNEEISIDDPQFWQKMVGEGQDDGEEDDLTGKRRKRNVTNYSEAHYGKKVEASLRLSDAEDDDDDEESGDDESYGSDDEGQKRERHRWGGSRPSDWKKDEAKKLIGLLHGHGYGALGWSRLVNELGAKNPHSEKEVQRMCWSILLTALCEIADEDAAHIKRRAVRAAEKKRDAPDGSSEQALGGVLAASKGDSASDPNNEESVQKCFDKLWIANASWAVIVLKDALAFAASTEPRSDEVLSRTVQTTEAPAKKDDISAKFAQSVWPSLKSRGWKAEILTDGANAGKTQYKYDGKQYLSPESVLGAVGNIHPELTNLTESMLSAAETSRQKSKESEAKLREKHLAMKAGTLAVKDLTDFLRKYAPLQLVFDRKSAKKLHMSARKMLHACTFLETAKALVKRAESVKGTSELIETLSASLHVEKRMSLPHPLWECKHDAVLIHAVAKHGWIDNDSSCRRITQDSAIRWGFPFDSATSPSDNEGTSANSVHDFIKGLRETAERAACFFNDHHDIIAEVKGFNQNVVIRAYALVHESSEETQAEDARPHWVVDEAALLASTGLQAGKTQEYVELPTKKDLAKRVKMILSRNAPMSFSNVAPAASTNEGAACVIDQSDRCNVFLAEVLKAVVKAPIPKSPKAIKTLCAVATEEALKRKESILSSLSLGKENEKKRQASDEMMETMQKIELSKKHIHKSSRQAKNVLRVLLSMEIIKSAKDPDFPAEAATRGGSLQKGAKEDTPSSKGKKEDSATGDRVLTRGMARCFNMNSGGPGVVSPEGNNDDLELTAMETLILTCVCSIGIPVWAENMSSHFAGEESKDPVDPSTQNELTLFWTGLGKVLISAAKEWHEGAVAKVEAYQAGYDRFEDKEESTAKMKARRKLATAIQLESVKELARAQAKEYAADPPIFAKKTVMLVERLRRKMGLQVGGSKKTTNQGLGPKIFDYIEEQLGLWAKNLDIVDDHDRTLSYTAADFFHDLPEEERDELEVITYLNKQDCKMLLIQITLLTRLRSLFIKHPKGELSTRIATAAKNCKVGDSWDDQPAWWGTTDDGPIHDVRLLEGLVEFGFGGVLDNARGFGPPSETQAQRSLRDNEFTLNKVQQRANQLTRELHNLERSDDVLRFLDKRRSKAGGKATGNPKAAKKGAAQKDDSGKDKKKQTALESFFSKTAASSKVSSVVVELSDAEDATKEAVARGVHIVPLDMSPKGDSRGNRADPDGFRLKDGGHDVVLLLGGKREGDESMESPSPEKKLRSS
ncbi:CHD3-type chromatin-remodeling factor PICKLE [Seminavis robusta]|uniref:CHD3-type chromatin-remodeling factor PICKLE n=1 Tax=Seminavis robusta TaxID=568900 RepID=A0A9N8D4B6_9STRA|nr:CHD3-type chromatin-remodeling factor PICKLE [Seminavis robusta]|eukprot:Sro2_g001340.1 CHD3-type chromatin-remodeling factor PICKLE (2321) ;mRNA; r:115934-123992